MNSTEFQIRKMGQNVMDEFWQYNNISNICDHQRDKLISMHRYSLGGF